MFLRKIGIDLGTANTLVFVPGKGIVINEPSVVAVSLYENKVLAVGNEAKEMLGRTPDSILASQPWRDGAIADYRVTEAMLRYFIGKVSGRVRFFRPEVVLSIPAGITSTERRAVVDAAMNDLMRPALYDAWHDIVKVMPEPGGNGNAAAMPYEVVGPVCESGDFLGHDRELALNEGDLLAILSAGAYGMAMASNYNSRPRAAEVMIDGASMHLIRRREEISQLFALESILQ